MQRVAIISIVFSLVVFVGIGGCDSYSPEIESVEATALSANAKRSPTKTRHLEGTVIGTSVDIPEDPAVECDPPVGPITSPIGIQMTGPIRHLGLTTLSSTACQVLTGIAFPSAFLRGFDGLGTLEAANGDKIFGSSEYEGVINLNCSAPSAFTGVLSVTGGTGRFAGAVGTINWSGTQVPSACPPDSEPPPLTLEIDVDGTIELPH